MTDASASAALVDEAARAQGEGSVSDSRLQYLVLGARAVSQIQGPAWMAYGGAVTMHTLAALAFIESLFYYADGAG